jgi:putative ABC transport system ATP-binding protein
MHRVRSRSSVRRATRQGWPAPAPSIDSTESMIIVTDLEKTYRSGDGTLTVLRDVNLRIDEGEFVAVIGPSGSGKSTLLGLLAGLDTPSSGSVHLDGTELGRLSEDERALLRRYKIGFVFQSFQLIGSLSAQENVQVPLELRGDADAAERAALLLERVGLGARRGHYPTQLSGGEQQRVALARAFVHRPRILFADEPTGNLDAATGHRDHRADGAAEPRGGTTLVLVTHDPELAARAPEPSGWPTAASSPTAGRAHEPAHPALLRLAREPLRAPPPLPLPLLDHARRRRARRGAGLQRGCGAGRGRPDAFAPGRGPLARGAPALRRAHGGAARLAARLGRRRRTREHARLDGADAAYRRHPPRPAARRRAGLPLLRRDRDGAGRPLGRAARRAAT